MFHIGFNGGCCCCFWQEPYNFHFVPTSDFFLKFVYRNLFCFQQRNPGCLSYISSYDTVVGPFMVASCTLKTSCRTTNRTICPYVSELWSRQAFYRLYFTFKLTCKIDHEQLSLLVAEGTVKEAEGSLVRNLVLGVQTKHFLSVFGE